MAQDRIVIPESVKKRLGAQTGEGPAAEGQSDRWAPGRPINVPDSVRARIEARRPPPPAPPPPSLADRVSDWAGAVGEAAADWWRGLDQRATTPSVSELVTYPMGRGLAGLMSDPGRPEIPPAPEAPAPRGAPAMVRPEFVAKLRDEFGKIEPERRMSTLVGMSKADDVFGRAARQLLTQVEDERRRGDQAAMMFFGPEGGQATREVLRAPRTAQLSLGDGASAAVPIPDVTPGFGDIMDGTGARQIAERRIEDQQVGKIASAGMRDWRRSEAQRQADKDRAFAAENPNLAAVQSGGARALSGGLNSLPALADLFNKVITDPLLGLVGADPMPRAPVVKGTQALDERARNLMPEVATQSLADAWSNEQFAPWLVANLGAQAPQLIQSMMGILSPGTRAIVLGSMGAQATGGSYAEGEDPRIAVTRGAIEILSEMLPFQAADKIKDMILRLPSSARAGVVAEAGKRIAAAGAAVSAMTVVGAIEEVVAELGNNILDIGVLGQDKSLAEGLPEAAVIGGAMGKVMSLPNAATALAGDRGPEAQVARIIDQNADLWSRYFAPKAAAPMPPTQAREASVKRFDELAAAFGLNPKAAAKVREQAGTMAASEAPGFLARVTRSLNQRGMFKRPVDDAGIGELGQVMDQVEAPEGQTKAPAAAPAPAVGEGDFTGLDTPEASKPATLPASDAPRVVGTKVDGTPVVDDGTHLRTPDGQFSTPPDIPAENPHEPVGNVAAPAAAPVPPAAGGRADAGGGVGAVGSGADDAGGGVGAPAAAPVAGGGTAGPVAGAGDAGPALTPRVIGKIGRTPKAAADVEVRPNADGTLTPYMEGQPLLDYDSAEPIVVPAESTDREIADAIERAGAIGGKSKFYGVADGPAPDAAAPGTATPSAPPSAAAPGAAAPSAAPAAESAPAPAAKFKPRAGDKLKLDGKDWTVDKVTPKAVTLTGTDGKKKRVEPGGPTWKKLAEQNPPAPAQTLAEIMAGAPDAAATPAQPAVDAESAAPAPAAAPATHADPGKPVEPVTQAVVKEAITKAADNRDRKPSEMKRELLRMVDEAIPKATHESRTQVPRGAAARDDPAHYIRFKVPGDGTFTVMNAKDALAEFRARVEKSPGFKDRQSVPSPERTDKRAPFGVEKGSSSPAAAIRSMIDENDLQAAVDYAAFRGLNIADILKGDKARRGKVAGLTPTAEAVGEFQPEAEPAALAQPAAEPENPNRTLSRAEYEAAVQERTSEFAIGPAGDNVPISFTQRKMATDRIPKRSKARFDIMATGSGAGRRYWVVPTYTEYLRRRGETEPAAASAATEAQQPRDELKRLQAAIDAQPERIPVAGAEIKKTIDRSIPGFPSDRWEVLVDGQVLSAWKTEKEAKKFVAEGTMVNPDWERAWDDMRAFLSRAAEAQQAAPSAPAPEAEPAAQPQAAQEGEGRPSLAPMPAVAGIPREAAQNAHRGTSFVPEERAGQEQQSFMAALQDAWAKAARIAGQDEKARERITEVFRDVADGYRARYMRTLDASSRVMSSMIAGPARFPVERNRKRMETERKRADEAQQYLDRGIKRLIRAARGPIDNSPESELESIRLRLAEREETQEAMKAANVALRKGDDAALEDLGFTAEQIAQLKKGDFAGRKGFPDYKLTNNNAEIRRLRERLTEAEARLAAAQAGPTETERAGVRIVEDAQDDRLRLIFDGKPSEEVREALKAAGFKWSPKSGAWQRQLTDNAKGAARRVLDRHFPATESGDRARSVDAPTDEAGNTPMLSRAAPAGGISHEAATDLAATIDAGAEPAKTQAAQEASGDGETPAFQRSATPYNVGDAGGARDDTRPGAVQAVGVLDRAIGRHVGDASVHPYVARFVPGDEAIRSVAAALGARVQWFGLREVLTPAERRKFGFFNGVYFDGTIYLRDAGSDRPHLAVLGHELVHRMKATRPTLYKRFLEEVRPLVDQARYAEFVRTSSVVKDVKGADAIREEFLGEVMADAFMDRGFWRALADKNPSVFGRVVKMLHQLIDAVLKAVGYTPRTARILTDFRRVMDIAADVMAEYADAGGAAAASELRFAAVGAPTYFSALARAVDAASMKVAPAAGWQQWLKGQVQKGVIKADEIAWTGMEEWLALQGAKVTRDQVRDFVRGNGVEVTETVLGAAGDRQFHQAMSDLYAWATAEANAGRETPMVGAVLSGEDIEAIQRQRRRIGVEGRAGELVDAALAVHRPWTDRKTKYGQYALPGGPLSRDTEILSRDGWLRMDEVQVGDIVMTRRDEDGALEWQEVEAVPTVFADKLYHFKNQSINMRVTACHNMLVKRRRRSSAGLFRAKAADLWSMSECVAPLVGEWRGKATDDLYGYRPEDAAELIGWYISEGSAVTKEGKKSTLAIAQSHHANPEKCARIEALLSRMGIAWNYVASGPSYYLSIKTMDRGLVEVLHAQGDSRSKFVPGFIFDQPPTVLRSLMDGMLLGDGHLASANDPKREPRWIYHTNCRRLADDMQTLALLCGLRATISQRPTGLYEVRLNSKQWASIDDAKHAIVDYNDTAFCVTVKNHAIYVRTGGVAAFTGNSNYREILLTLPTKPDRLESAGRWAVVNERGDVLASFDSKDRAQRVYEAQGSIQGHRIEEVMHRYKDDGYRSSHWDAPNVLAHIRVNDRLSAPEPYRARERSDNFERSELAPLLPLDVVESGVAGLVDHDEVRRAVVSALPVDVVNMLATLKLSPESLLGNKPVSADLARAPLAVRFNVLSGLVTALGKTEATLRAKVRSALSAGRDEQLLPALRASDLSRVEVGRLLGSDQVGASDALKTQPASATARATLSGARRTGAELSAADSAALADLFARASLGAEARTGGLVGRDGVLAPASDAQLLDAHERIVEVRARTDNAPKRVLFVEEIQSDWAQEGKKKGFKAGNSEAAAIQAEYDAAAQAVSDAHNEGGNVQAARERLARATDAYNARINDATIPTAPFIDKTNKWIALALKRIVKLAVDEGYDAVAFVTGEQSAERFSLDKHLSLIEFGKRGSDAYRVKAYDKNDAVVRNMPSEMSAAELERHLGKEIAQKIVDQGSGRLEGDGLKVEAAGMRAFYDRIVPLAARDVLRRLGVGEHSLGGKAVAPKVDRNGGLVDAEAIRDLALSQPFKNEGFKGLSPDAKRLVQTHMLALSKDRQVLQAIVGSVPVDVVNVLSAKQLSPEMFFHDPAMLVDDLAAKLGADVAARIDVPTALVRAAASVAAEQTAVGAGRLRRAGGEQGGTVGTGLHGAILAPIEIPGIGSQPGFEITPAIREKAAGGLPLFQRSNPNHTPEQTAALAKAGIAGPRSMREKVRAYYGAALQMVSNRNHLAHTVRQGALDQFHGIRQAVRRELGNLPVEQDPYIAARLANGGTSSVMRALMMHGQARWTKDHQHLEKIPGTKGLLDILAPLGDDLNDWFGWMVGNRAERLLKEGRENNLTAADIKALKALATPDKLRKFQAAAIEYAAFKRSVLDVAQSAGLIDPEARKVWDHADYIPFYREIDEKATFSATGKGYRGVKGIRKSLSHQTSGIRKLKGGTAGLNDPMENLLMNFSRLIDASLKNNAILKTVRMIEQVKDQAAIKKIGYDFRPAIIPREQIRQALVDAGTPPDVLDAMPEDVFDGMAKVWQIQQPNDPDVIRVMVGGKPKFYRVRDAMLLRSLTSFVPFDFPGLALMRGAKTLLTKLVTATPEFMVRNWIRDSVAAQAIARHGFSPAASVKGVAKAFSEAGGFESMLFAGASFQTGQYSAHDPEAAAVAMRRALRSKGMKAGAVDDFMATVLDTPGRAWDVYRRAGEAIENANREAVYEAAIKAGGSETQAAYQAKDLMDFSLRGSWPAYQVLADTIVFLNARVQGMYRLGRSDPKRLWRVGAMLMVASLVLASFNDGEDWYEELPDWDKDLYWHMMIAGKHVRIPKPFEVGVFFATMPERIGRAIKGLDDGDKTMQRALSNARDQLAIDPVPQLIRPALDVYANWDPFRRRPVEDQSDEGKLPSARYSAVTSDTAKLVSGAVEPLSNAVGMSPKRIEYLIGGYFGTIGLYALGASDWMVRELQNAPERPTLRPDDIPLVRAFIRADPARGTVYESDLWAMRQEIEQIKRTILSEVKSGNVEGATKRLAESEAKLEAAGPVLGTVEALSEINKARDAIYADRKMTPAEKRAKLDELQRERNRLAREAATDPSVRAAF